MHISPTGIALIKQFEGFSRTPYRCPAGKWTIGYGHVIRETGFKIRDSTIDEAQAEALLKNDLQRVEAAVSHFVTVPLSQQQFDALCSLTYNIGISAFSGSTLLRLLNAGDKAASRQFLRWIYAGKQPLAGLISRRQKERELFDKTDGYD